MGAAHIGPGPEVFRTGALSGVGKKTSRSAPSGSVMHVQMGERYYCDAQPHDCVGLPEEYVVVGGASHVVRSRGVDSVGRQWDAPRRVMRNRCRVEVNVELKSSQRTQGPVSDGTVSDTAHHAHLTCPSHLEGRSHTGHDEKHKKS